MKKILFVTGDFWVQKIGPFSVDLAKLTQDMTEYYRDEVNQKFHSITSVAPGDFVACRFSNDESFYRAKVVTFKVCRISDSNVSV